MLPVRMVLVLLPLVTAGCASMVGMAAGPTAAIGTTVLSGKTPVDQLYSAVSGKDCSIRRNRQGLTYCVEDEPVLPVRVVCYRTLGDVSCYDHPDPFESRQRAIVEDAGVTLVPFAVPNAIPPGLLQGLRPVPPPVAQPEQLQEAEPTDAVDAPLALPGQPLGADGGTRQPAGSPLFATPS